MKKIIYLVLLLPFLGLSQMQIGQDIDGESSGDLSGSVSLSSDGNILAIGAFLNTGNGNNSGHVRIYENIGGVWIQVGQDIDGEGENDQFGESISLSHDGGIVAIGASFNDGNGNNSGHVRIYENIGGIWTQIGDDINGEAMNDFSGSSVSLNSDGIIVAIGAISNDGNGSNSGHVRVYENIGGVWVQIGDDINGEAAGDRSGRSVSLSSDGNTVAIGADGNDGNGIDSGHVRLYKNIGGIWVQIGDDINGEATDDSFGWAISLSSDSSTVAIGAYFNDGNGFNSGHVRVFKNVGSAWIQIGDDIDGEIVGDAFGWSLSLSLNGDIVAIGAILNDGSANSSGHVRLYKNNDNSWTQFGENIEGEAQGDESGKSVSLSLDGSIVAIGAYFNDGNGSNSGHVRVFSIASELALLEVIEDIAGNNNGINVTAEQLNSIEGVSGAIDGIDYTTALQNGTFTDPNSPTAAEIQLIIDQVNDTLSINYDEFFEFQLYPNPAKHQFTIQLNNTSVLENVRIYNSLGQEILTSTESTVNTSNLTSGLYIVEILTNKGKASKTLILY